MKNLKFHIYFLFFLTLIINGCNCDNDIPSDYVVYLTCGEIDKVSKTFTFEVYAKWEDGEPIQNGELSLIGTNYNFTLIATNSSDCEYKLDEIDIHSQSVNFDETGHATIIIGGFTFDNKHDHLWIHVGPFFPNIGADYLRNAKRLRLDYNSKQKNTINIIFVTHDL
ncbi:MAG TPA: hypothetical protein ENK91_12315 [Bacteroidetes bacterium]|nr:hypothetical protein [Bacteroidota bacterium]